MACPDFEELVRDGSGGHAMHCEECSALLEALAEVDSNLEAAYGGISAPPALATVVRLRIGREGAEHGPSMLPEVLDFIGWAAVLALFAVLAPRLVPLLNEALEKLS
jgi:hypothetical protein